MTDESERTEMEQAILGLIAYMDSQEVPLKKQKAFVGIWLKFLNENRTEDLERITPQLNKLLFSALGNGNSVQSCQQAFDQNPQQETLKIEFQELMVFLRK